MDKQEIKHSIIFNQDGSKELKLSDMASIRFENNKQIDAFISVLEALKIGLAEPVNSPPKGSDNG